MIWYLAGSISSIVSPSFSISIHFFQILLRVYLPLMASNIFILRFPFGLFLSIPPSIATFSNPSYSIYFLSHFFQILMRVSSSHGFYSTFSLWSYSFHSSFNRNLQQSFIIYIQYIFLGPFLSDLDASIFLSWFLFYVFPLVFFFPFLLQSQPSVIIHVLKRSLST